jgi:NADH-quinone oxidoreductase subunit J
LAGEGVKDAKPEKVLNVELAFYSAAAVAIAATLGVITGKNPVHALLYLIVSLLSVAVIFFAIGASFAGALEIIVYAGAIMVLFIFVVMMLNLGPQVIEQERLWLKPTSWFGPSLLSLALLAVLGYALLHSHGGVAGVTPVTPKDVGIALYGPYLLVVELASMLLLAALVTAYHIGRNTEKD